MGIPPPINFVHLSCSHGYLELHKTTGDLFSLLGVLFILIL